MHRSMLVVHSSGREPGHRAQGQPLSGEILARACTAFCTLLLFGIVCSGFVIHCFLADMFGICLLPYCVIMIVQVTRILLAQKCGLGFAARMGYLEL